jgi:hypothetical protein
VKFFITFSIYNVLLRDTLPICDLSAWVSKHVALSIQNELIKVQKYLFPDLYFLNDPCIIKDTVSVEILMCL